MSSTSFVDYNIEDFEEEIYIGSKIAMPPGFDATPDDTLWALMFKNERGLGFFTYNSFDKYKDGLRSYSERVSTIDLMQEVKNTDGKVIVKSPQTVPYFEMSMTKYKVEDPAIKFIFLFFPAQIAKSFVVWKEDGEEMTKEDIHEDFQDIFPKNIPEPEDYVGDKITSAASKGLIMDLISLHSYKTRMIKLVNKTWVVDERADPVNLLLSCLTMDGSKAPETYLRLIHENWTEVHSLYKPTTSGCVHSRRIPTDVCTLISHLLIYFIGKMVNEASLKEQITKRTEAFKASTGFNVNYPQLKVAMFTSYNNSMQNNKVVRELIGDVLTKDGMIEKKWQAHIAGLTEYTCMLAYTKIEKFFAMKPTAAHFRYVSPAEIIEYKKKSNYLKEHAINLKYSYFYQPELIPRQAAFPNLTGLAYAVATLSESSMKNAKAKGAREYPNLAADLNLLIDKTTVSRELLKIYNISAPIRELNEIFKAMGLGPIETVEGEDEAENK
jgi:hypothetical protein